MRRLGMLLGLVLFMTASPALAVNSRLEVYDKSSYERRWFTPPGNIEFKIPLPKSKWSCFLEKAEHNKEGVLRAIVCTTPGGYPVASICVLPKGSRDLGYASKASLALFNKTDEKHKGYTLHLTCEP